MGQTDRPDDRRAAGSRLPSNSESAVKRNHETPKSGIPKRKKIEACPRLSCKIQYLLASNHRDQSTTSEYFTDDYLIASTGPLLVGRLRDVSGDFRPGMWLCVGVAVIMLLLTPFLRPKTIDA